MGKMGKFKKSLNDSKYNHITNMTPSNYFKLYKKIYTRSEIQ